MAIGWAALTRIPLKAVMYERETYFRECLSQALEVFGPRFEEHLWSSALLMVKPDGIAAGKLSTVCGFLEANEFEILAVERLRFSRFIWRELWRYQLTSATLDRLAVNEHVLTGEGLLLLLHQQRAIEVPASVVLSGLKGPSDVAAQAPGCLRQLLSQPNRVCSYIHVCDEPADLVRELGVLLDHQSRRRVLSALAGGELSAGDRRELERALASDSAPRWEFDAEASLRRAAAAIEAQRDPPPAGDAGRRAADAVERMKRGERVEWRSFLRALSALGVELGRWDLATLGTQFIAYDEPGHPKLIQSVDPELWRRGPGAGLTRVRATSFVVAARGRRGRRGRRSPA